MLINITLPLLGTLTVPMIFLAVSTIALPATALLMLCVWLDSRPEKAGN